MNIKEIREKLRLVLDDLGRASNAKSENAFDICQGLEYSEVLLSDMIEKLEPHETILIGGFTNEDIRDYLESEDIIFLSEESFEDFIQHITDKFDASIGLSWELMITHFEVWKDKNK